MLSRSMKKFPPPLLSLHIHNVNYLEDRSKGESLGPYILKVQGQPGFTLNGTMKVSGKIIPFYPEPIPTTLMTTVNIKMRNRVRFYQLKTSP
jgi:hypothetical protein